MGTAGRCASPRVHGRVPDPLRMELNPREPSARCAYGGMEAERGDDGTRGSERHLGP
jgi:hypothetical protein